MSDRIFINYRRDDTAAEAQLIAQSLRTFVGPEHVFMDTSSFDVGETWPRHIRDALKSSRYVLVIVGPEWLRAGSNEWGQRRIDNLNDWVRCEIATAIADDKKTVIPVRVRGARIPPPNVLPSDIGELTKRQGLEIRRDCWSHDVKLLIAQTTSKEAVSQRYGGFAFPYPRKVPAGPEALDTGVLSQILDTELTTWKPISSQVPEDNSQIRVELFREFKFKSFVAAVGFMNLVAPGCDILNHHPRWENVWKTVRVFLTTWDIGHRISDRDVQLARYLDCAYSEYAGAIVASQSDEQSSQPELPIAPDSTS